MPPHASAKKQPLTLAQVSQYDDLLTDALIDHVYYWTTIPKNRPSYHATRGVTEEEISKIVQTHLIVEPDMELAESKLLETAGLRRFLNGLKTPKEKDDFRKHLRRYMQIYLPDCPYEVSTTNRYTIVTQEAAVTARQFIKKGQAVKYLSGIQVLITPEEERELSTRKKDFSIVVSSRSKCASLFMGPARFANHDCNANARLMITSQACIEIIAMRNIEVGDEITVTYSDNYFGEGNCECLCRTCEDNLVNGWRQPDEAGLVKTSIENMPLEGYSLRHKRRGDSCASDSRTPSLGPEIRPRIRKTRSKLQRSDSSNLSTVAPSAAENANHKRKRADETLRSPPTTPAKKPKSLQREVTPQDLLDAQEGQCSESQSVESSSRSASADAASTDVTTPEAEEETPFDQSLVSHDNPARSSIAAPRRPDPMSIATLTSTTVVDSIEYNTGIYSLWLPKTVGELGRAMMMTHPASARLRTTPPSALPAHEPPSPASTESPAKEALRGRGRPAARKHKLSLGSEGEGSTTMLSTTKRRTPGDYTLTPVLLSEPNTAWIHCMNCSEAFVQYNAYYTRSSCPRCERHSKLYGYTWPKTEPEGKHDKEERILDHRTVHRFLDRQGEARVRGRQMPATAVSNLSASVKAGRALSVAAGTARVRATAQRSSSIPSVKRSRSGRIISAPRFSDEL